MSRILTMSIEISMTTFFSINFFIGGGAMKDWYDLPGFIILQSNSSLRSKQSGSLLHLNRKFWKISII